jgi:hypothetical protein
LVSLILVFSFPVYSIVCYSALPYSMSAGAPAIPTIEFVPQILPWKNTTSQLGEKLNRRGHCNKGTASAGPQTPQNDSGL